MERLPSGLSDLVSDEESLARFLTSSSQFNAVMVKPSALLPSPKDRETSVFRHGGEPRESLWRVGRDNAAGDRHIHGVAVFKAKHVREADLDVTASEPPPRHASIGGWPWIDDLDLQKAAQKERAARIAQHAEVIEVE